MTSYKILRYPTMSFWDTAHPDVAHWNIRGIAFVNLGQFEVSSGQSVLCRKVTKFRLRSNAFSLHFLPTFAWQQSGVKTGFLYRFKIKKI